MKINLPRFTDLILKNLRSSAPAEYPWMVSSGKNGVFREELFLNAVIFPCLQASNVVISHSKKLISMRDPELNNSQLLQADSGGSTLVLPVKFLFKSINSLESIIELTIGNLKLEK